MKSPIMTRAEHEKEIAKYKEKEDRYKLAITNYKDICDELTKSITEKEKHIYKLLKQAEKFEAFEKELIEARAKLKSIKKALYPVFYMPIKIKDVNKASPKYDIDIEKYNKGKKENELVMIKRNYVWLWKTKLKTLTEGHLKHYVDTEGELPDRILGVNLTVKNCPQKLYEELLDKEDVFQIGDLKFF